MKNCTLRITSPISYISLFTGVLPCSFWTANSMWRWGLVVWRSFIAIQAFNLHSHAIRIISARDMSKKEQTIYEKREQGNTGIQEWSRWTAVLVDTGFSRQCKLGKSRHNNFSKSEANAQNHLTPPPGTNAQPIEAIGKWAWRPIPISLKDVSQGTARSGTLVHALSTSESKPRFA